jgi:hypothetical protein
MTQIGLIFVFMGDIYLMGVSYSWKRKSPIIHREQERTP